MAMVNCPNCGKRSYDDKVCCWCKYIIKEEPNPFDNIKYENLKREYLINPQKMIVIQLGVDKYGYEFSECKKIVDYIAESEYKKNNYKSSEMVNFTEKGMVFKFSFFQYFIRNFIFKICGALLLWKGVETVKITKYKIALLVILCAWIFISLYQLVKTATSKVIFENGKIEYSYQSSNHIAAGGGNKFESISAASRFEDYFGKHNIYEIDGITKVSSNMFHVTIHGKVKNKVARFWSERNFRIKEKKNLKYIKIPLYFKKNGMMIDKFKKKVK